MSKHIELLNIYSSEMNNSPIFNLCNNKKQIIADNQKTCNAIVSKVGNLNIKTKTNKPENDNVYKRKR